MEGMTVSGVIKVQLSSNRASALVGRRNNARALVSPCEHTARKQPSASQEELPPQTRNRTAARHALPNLQNYKK